MRKIILSTIVIFSLAVGALACNVPVFRYALDHWSADSYRAVILHRGPLSTEAQQAVDRLNASVQSHQCNLAVHMIDTQGTLSAVDQEYVDTCKMDVQSEPTLLLHYPSALETPAPVLTCALDGSSISKLLDSPLRRELLERLSQGQSAVWMLVKGGNPAQDAAAEQIIEKELRHLQATLELPKLTDDPADAVVGGPPLRVEFSLLTMDRQRAEERELVQMLISSEADLKELDEPILFAAFGRGRVLWPLVGPGISAENIKEMAAFVTGACSCQVKEQNPGFDLLLKAGWEELLPWTKSVTTPGLVQQNAAPELVPIPQGSGTVPSNEDQIPVVKVIRVSNEQVVSGLGWGRMLAVVCLVVVVPLFLHRLLAAVRRGR